MASMTVCSSHVVLFGKCHFLSISFLIRSDHLSTSLSVRCKQFLTRFPPSPDGEDEVEEGLKANKERKY